MIPRSSVNRFADRMGVDLHVAQQEVILVYALSALGTAGLLDRLVFKGGTYLRLMVTGDVGRLSEDLDFTNRTLPEDPEPLLADAFRTAFHGVQFEIAEPYRTARRNWASAVRYAHDWDAGEFRLEISYREPTFLPPGRWPPLPQSYFGELPFVPPSIPSLRVEEALAEKLRAVQQRATERDLYDILRYGRRGFDEALVRLLAVGKLWNDRERFDPERVLATLRAGRREWPEMERLIGRSRRRDWNRELEEVADRFAFLRALTPFEGELLEDVRRHQLGPRLRERIATAALGIAEAPSGAGSAAGRSGAARRRAPR